VSFDLDEAGRMLGRLVPGDLEELRVAERTPSGRVGRVEVKGSGGTRTATGVEIRALLGLRSTWFDTAVR
jgi:peptidoglycan hydrolase-like amidase